MGDLAEKVDREDKTSGVGLEQTRGKSYRIVYHHRTKSIDILSSPIAAIALGNDEGPKTGDLIDTADDEGAEFVVCTMLAGGSKGSPIAAASNSLNPGSSTFSF